MGENTKNDCWYKDHPGDKTVWLAQRYVIGEYIFRIDGGSGRIYNMFADYPHNMTQEDKRIFDMENPFWADFFKGR